MATLSELRAEHARLVKDMVYWEHEQVYRSDPADRADAGKRSALATGQAAAIKRQIEAILAPRETSPDKAEG